MHDNTRERIVEAGAGIMHLKGFQGTGLNEILAAAEVPKGSFYHYFGSKEEFGLAVIDHYDAARARLRTAVMERPGLTALERVDLLVSLFIERFAAAGFTLGCPIGNMAQEMGDQSEAFRARLVKSFEGLSGIFLELIQAGQAEGGMDPGLDPQETAMFLVGAMHGALVRMKVARSAEPLILFGRFARRLLTGCRADNG